MEPARRPVGARALRVAALAGLVLSGIVAAFATIPPQSEAELALARALIVEPLPIQQIAQVLAPTERFIREVSKPTPWAKVERHSVYSITMTVTLRKKVLCIKICSLESREYSGEYYVFNS